MKLIANLTPEEKQTIDAMSQLEMATLRRRAPIGHKYFDTNNKDLNEYFEKVFKEKGGMTPGLSKLIGWG